MVNKMKLLILLCYALVLTGCVSTNKLPQNNQFDFISTQCNVGDELEIGYPVPVIKEIHHGAIDFGYRIYHYDFKKNEWVEDLRRGHYKKNEWVKDLRCGQHLNIASRRCLGGIWDNNHDFSGLRSSLREEFIKIKVLKKGLFLVKALVEVSGYTVYDDDSKKYISSIVMPVIIDSRNSQQPLQHPIFPVDSEDQ